MKCLGVYADFTACKNTVGGHEYVGTIDITNTGEQCQRWDTQSPHSHSYTNENRFPDFSLSDAANYCRNPITNDDVSPWCYTMNPSVRWGHCDIPMCNGK